MGPSARRAGRARKAWSSGHDGRRGQVAPCIVLAEPDSYLTFLIHLEFPEVEVLEGGSDPEVVRQANLVIVDLDVPAALDLLDTDYEGRLLGIGDGRRARDTALLHGLDAVLLRPFLPEELYRAIRQALNLPEIGSGASSARLERIHVRLAWSRVAAVALAGLIEHVSASGGAPKLLILPMLVYAALRLFRPRTGMVGAAIDIGMSTVAIAATGGYASPYIALGVVASIEQGLLLGTKMGLLTSLLPAVGSAPGALAVAQRGTAEPSQLLAWFALFPLAALIGAFMARLSRPDRRAGSALLAEANRLLSSLFRIARTMPGGFDVRAVASGALEEARESLGSPAGVVLARQDGLIRGVASLGLRLGEEIGLPESEVSELVRGRGATVLSAQALPATLGASLAAYSCWISAPLRRGGQTFGVLLSACGDHARHGDQRILLEALAEETAMGIENARLFARVRELSADEERRRLARELHDGVAQDLAHVRLELELLGRRVAPADEAGRGEAARLSRVVGRALNDVRTTIQGLRSSVSDSGLAGSLVSYLRDLQGLGGPEIVFKGGAPMALSPEVEAEVFRIAQEAVSNALRHARASRIEVSLGATRSGLRLAVSDDGVGMPAGPTRVGGLGLIAMRERAQVIGGDLSIGKAAGGGTRVELLLNRDSSVGIDGSFEEARPA